MIENNGLTVGDRPKTAQIAPPNSEVGLTSTRSEILIACTGRQAAIHPPAVTGWLDRQSLL